MIKPIEGNLRPARLLNLRTQIFSK